MKNIKHYEDKEICNKDLPSLEDPKYREQTIQAQQSMKQSIDNGSWRDSPWCETFTEQFVEEIIKCKVFVDVGAEVGFYTYLALNNMPPDGRIIVFEPDPIRYQLLKEFFSPYENVTILDFAVSDIEGETTFVKPHGLSATCVDVKGEKFRVHTVALDDFLREEKVDVIKMDIEGGEANAFKGMQKILSKGNTAIFLERHYWVDEVFPGGTQFMEQLLKNAKYQVYNSDEGRLVPTNKLKGVRFFLNPEKKDVRRDSIRPNKTSFQIDELVLDYTRRCDSHCTYCGIWEIKNGPELDLGAIENVFKSPQLRNLKSCYVTGGEPYISDKIVDVAALLHKYLPDCLLTGATNGIQCEKILERALKIRDMGCKIHLHVSLNGTRSTHDATRGQMGYWDKAVTLVDRLIANGISTLVAFSMMPQTAQDLPYMQEFCAARGIPMEFVWVRQSERYGTVDETFSTWPEAVKPNLRLIENLPDYFDCPALQKRLVVTPDGSVYPCEMYLPNLLLGNVNERPLENILDDPHTAEVAEMIANRGCTWCQGTGEADGGPKWMVMDCYRRQSPQALELKKRQPQARYMQPKQSACVVSEVIGAPVDTGSQIVYKPATIEEVTKKFDDKLPAIAIRDFERLLRVYPNNAAFLRELADLYYWKTNVTKAAPLFNKACSIEPSSDTAWEGLVNSLIATGEKKLVMKALDLWLQAKPGSTRAPDRLKRFKCQEKLVHSLHNRHEGQRAFILGNGPSLLDFDLSPLKNEVTFGVNGLCQILSFLFAPTYYCVSDVRSWKEFGAKIMNFPSLKIISVPPCKNVPEREDFLRLPLNWHQQIHQGYFAGTTESFYQTHVGWTVVLDICLQVAYYMGFSEVYLLGVDLAARDGRAHAYDEKREESATQWTSPQFSRMIQSFRLARQIYERAGRKVYNLSQTSKLDVFEKRDFASVLGGSGNGKSKSILSLPGQSLVQDVVSEDEGITVNDDESLSGEKAGAGDLYDRGNHIPDISVLLCSYNRADTLKRCLEALEKQTLSRDRFEVICVNDGSTDHTSEIMKAAPKRLPGSYHEHANNRGLAAARNTAIRASRGRLVLFINDDTYPEPDLLEQHTQMHQMHGNERVAVFGHISFAPEHAERILSQVLHQHNRLFPLVGTREGVPYDFNYFVTANLSVARQAFVSENIWFDETFRRYGCEDIEVGYRLWKRGYRVYYCPRAKVIHDHRLTVHDYQRRTVDNSSNLVQFVDKHPELVRRYLGVPRPTEAILAQWRQLIKREAPVIKKMIDRIAAVEDATPAALAGPTATPSDTMKLVKQIAVLLGHISTHIKRLTILQILDDSPDVRYRLVNGTGSQPQPKTIIEGNPLVSVIIPSYNYACYLPEAVGSVLNQTYRNFEIIIVNDGSPDDTKEVAEKLIAEHPQHQIRLVNQANSGPAVARNKGIAEAKGEYILPLDADDKLAPQAIELCLRAAKDYPGQLVVVYGWMKRFGVEETVWRTRPFSPNQLLRRGKLPYCSMFHRAIWELQDGYKTTPPGYEDRDFWIGAAKIGAKFINVPEIIFFYRKTELTSQIDRYRKDHEWLFAGVIINHSDVFEDEEVAWATDYLERFPQPPEEREIHGPGDKFPMASAVLVAFYPELYTPQEVEWAKQFLRKNPFDILKGIKPGPANVSAFRELLKHEKELPAKLSYSPVGLPSRGESDDIVSAVSANRPHPKVSIITSCYNSEKFLPECIDSIRNQTMQDWELFLLDDASTDDTKSIIEKYSRMDERIRPYYFQDNKGPYVRRNFAIERSRSDFITIHDADDIMVPTKLEILYNEITRDEQLVIVGSFYRKFIDEFKGLENTEIVEFLIEHDDIMKKARSNCNFCCHGSAIIRKDLFGAIGLYDENPFSSDAFWLSKVVEYVYHSDNVRVKNIPECLMLRRMHAASQTGLFPSFDPRGRRDKFLNYRKEKIREIREKLDNNSGEDIKAELRNCKCNDYIEKCGHLFEQWESEPLDYKVLGRLVGKGVELFNSRKYVTCITRLNGMEKMECNIAKRFKNYDLLRALAYFAIDMKQQSLEYLNREIQNHSNSAARRFISDCFERQLKTDVQSWYCENAGLYELRMIDTGSEQGDRVSVAPLSRSRPKVSVILSCYNSEKFLPECIDSIRNQTMQDWELFVLDDAGTDGTKSIIEKYSLMDERIKAYYFRDNKGPYVRRNFAIERANSDFIVIQDADDIMRPAKLETLYNEITTDERLGIVGSFYHSFLDEFKGLQYAEEQKFPLEHNGIIGKLGKWQAGIWHCSAIIRKELFESIGLYDENPFGADSFWLAKVAEYARCTADVKLKNIPEFLTLRRTHSGSQTQIIPTHDPRGIRGLYQRYCEGKLKKLRPKLESRSRSDTKAELKNCNCSDFVEKYGHLFAQWENRPLDSNTLPVQVGKAVKSFSSCRYVTCITRLNGMEKMECNIAKRFKNYDLLRALAYFAIDMKQQSLEYLNREIQNHSNSAARRFISDCFERQLKTDVQSWCCENAGLYELRMIDTGSEQGDRVSVAPLSRSRPKVSVILSCYNSEKFLPECIDSIRNQTMQDWELFVLDDAGTDGTKSIIEKYSRMDERIKAYYFQDNKGPYVRRNFAIERANSDFIVIQDADDIMCPAKMETLYDEITTDERLGIVGSSYRSFLDEFRGLEYTDSHDLPLEHNEVAAKFSSFRHGMSHGSAIIRKELFDAIGLYDENPFSSDTFWLAKAAEYSKHCADVRFKNLPEYLTLLRKHGSSQTQILPTFDPRSRRKLYQRYCKDKLREVRQKLEDSPHADIKTELKNCICSDFIEKFGHLFAKWESEPLDNKVLKGLSAWAVELFNTHLYVTCVTTLNGMEIMEPNIVKRFKNYDLLRAMAYLAIDRKEQGLTYLNREIENYNNLAARKFISDYFEGPDFAKTAQNVNSEKHLKTDVQSWCSENSKFYDLRIIDLENERDTRQEKRAVCRQNVPAPQGEQGHSCPTSSSGQTGPLVSIIMPVYNMPDYVAEAIGSVLTQGYRNFELIVVDDGSTDNTKDIILGFKDERVKYFYKENGGPYSARNLGMKNAGGDFIVPLDADDMITPDYIVRHLQEFERCPDADLIYCDDCLIEEDCKPIRVIERPEYTDRKLLIRDLFRCGFPIVPFRTCIRKSVFDRIGLFDDGFRNAMDYDMIRRFVKHGLKAHHLKAPLYIRRMIPDSVSRKVSDEKVRAHFEVLRRFTESFSYDELFPDVAWDKIAPEMRQLHAKCLAAMTYLAIGQTFIKTHSPVYGKMAFGQACSELRDSLEMDPGNRRIRQLLQKCEFGRQKYDEQIQQTVR